MTKLAKELPTVFGFYLPADRSTDYTGDLVDPYTGVVTHPPSMTKQEFLAECDINNIVKEYLITGQIAHINARARDGAFMDLPDSVDYQESLNTVLRADAAFAELPSGIRNRFDNDPEKFLAFCGDPANTEELITLGLAKDTRPPPKPTPAAAEPPAKPSGAAGTPSEPSPPGKGA